MGNDVGAMTLAETEDAIERIYRTAGPRKDLDPDRGVLGALWSRFDYLVAKEG